MVCIKKKKLHQISLFFYPIFHQIFEMHLFNWSNNQHMCLEYL